MMVAYLLRRLYDKTNFPGTLNVYQHAVGVNFPGEVVKVHSAESYLVGFDLYTDLIYY